MIPVAFDYVEASSVEHALALFAENDDAKFLAGGTFPSSDDETAHRVAERPDRYRTNQGPLVYRRSQ